MLCKNRTDSSRASFQIKMPVTVSFAPAAGRHWVMC